MKKPFIEIDTDNFCILGFDILPPEGYEPPKNFPNCCDFHGEILTNGILFYDEFPNCCDAHKKTRFKPWFSKTNYTGLPLKIVNQHSFTEHIIARKINNSDWYEDITDYIEFNAYSFGHPAVGLHMYLHALKHYIAETTSKLPKQKQKKLIQFIDGYYKTTEPCEEKIDFNVLYDIYQKWMSTFPFGIDYFKKLKENFFKTFPILNGKVKTNRYSGIVSGQVVTKKELIDSLINTTIRLLKSVNSSELIHNVSVADFQKQQIQLITENHNVTQTALLQEFNEDENKYLIIIQKWLQNEKTYFSEIAPLLTTQTQPKMPKNFDLEIGETFDTKYLKAFIKDTSRLNEISAILGGLSSVKLVNTTGSQAAGSPDKNLTIYPSRVYDIQETYNEVEFTLKNYFQGSPIDPSFNTEIISGISEKAYYQIIDRILTFGKNLEKFQGLYNHFDEEKFRDFFLPHLNSISTNHTGTGETFNKKGKTDILIQDQEGNNIFIAECKLWKGQSELKNAIGQLLGRYVNWRDEKVALIIFNKDAKGFSEVVAKAIEATKGHPLFESYVGNRKDTSHSFIFKNPDDPQKKIALELIIFNCTQ